MKQPALPLSYAPVARCGGIRTRDLDREGCSSTGIRHVSIVFSPGDNSWRDMSRSLANQWPGSGFEPPGLAPYHVVPPAFAREVLCVQSRRQGFDKTARSTAELRARSPHEGVWWTRRESNPRPCSSIRIRHVSRLVQPEGAWLQPGTFGLPSRPIGGLATRSGCETSQLVM